MNAPISIHSPAATPAPPMNIKKLPTLLAPFVGANLLLMACTTPPAVAAPVASHRHTAPPTTDDREFDMNTGGWETPPIWAQHRD